MIAKLLLAVCVVLAVEAVATHLGLPAGLSSKVGATAGLGVFVAVFVRPVFRRR